MDWAKPRFDRRIVDEAGRTFIDKEASAEAREFALQVISNWRSSHNFPLNTFQMGLRHKARNVDQRSLIAQRTKRLRAIEAKLQHMSHLRLSRMQDVGGCRAIVRSVPGVNRLANAYKHSDIKHELIREDNYILTPRSSGYRGIHLVYGYYGRNPAYDGLRVEMQIRSHLQHCWATAVETVGMFRGEALKSGQGDTDWLRFFALMGTAIAVREKSPPVPATPTDGGLARELQEYCWKLDIFERLNNYRTALTILPHRRLKGGHYFLLEFDRDTNTIRIRSYPKGSLEAASTRYLEIERGVLVRPELDAVLVSSVDDLKALKRAYPNYFLDTRRFLDAVRQATS